MGRGEDNERALHIEKSFSLPLTCLPSNLITDILVLAIFKVERKNKTTKIYPGYILF